MRIELPVCKHCREGEHGNPEDDLTVVTADPDDDKFLEAAVAGRVDYIVSGDPHLLDLDTFRGIDIITPRIFAEQLGVR
jgi:predicted nucleic acid-binding protein